MKLLRFSLYAVASLAIIIGTALAIYFTDASNGYLYFTKSSFLAHFGESASIEDFGLKCSESLDDINFELGDGVVREEDRFTFTKTGDTYIKATCGYLKASINVQVVFDEIEEYFDIYCDYNCLSEMDEEVNIGETIKLYLPSNTSQDFKADGYDNDCNILVDFYKEEYDYSLITYQDVVKCDGNRIIANSVGTSKIFVSFDKIGICANFDVEVLPISVVDILVDDDTLYVQKGEEFLINYNILPTYATYKDVNVNINNSNIKYVNNKFYAVCDGNSIITLSCGSISKSVSVVIGEIADEIDVKVYGDVKMGESISIVSKCYKNGTLIDADVEYVIVAEGQEVTLDVIAEDISYKHNTLSMKIKTSMRFEIIVRVKKNIVISQTIYGNN